MDITLGVESRPISTPKPCGAIREYFGGQLPAAVGCPPPHTQTHLHTHTEREREREGGVERHTHTHARTQLTQQAHMPQLCLHVPYHHSRLLDKEAPVDGIRYVVFPHCHRQSLDEGGVAVCVDLQCSVLMEPCKDARSPLSSVPFPRSQGCMRRGGSSTLSSHVKRACACGEGGGGWHKASVSDCVPLAAPAKRPVCLTVRRASGTQRGQGCEHRNVSSGGLCGRNPLGLGLWRSWVSCPGPTDGAAIAVCASCAPTPTELQEVWGGHSGRGSCQEVSATTEGRFRGRQRDEWWSGAGAATHLRTASHTVGAAREAEGMAHSSRMNV